MQKIVCFFFAICLCLTSNLIFADVVPSLHVCTVSSKNAPGLERLMHTCKQYNIKIDVLGMGLPYPSNGVKLAYMEQYVKDLPDADVVLFVDAWDILFMSDSQTILNAFLDMKAPLVVSAERVCFPDKSLAPQYPDSPTIFKYVNSGSYIGYVSAIKDLLQSMQPIDVKKCDQWQVSLQYVKDPSKIKLDYYCTLFWPLTRMSWSDIVVDTENKTVYSHITKNKPLIVHGNGRGRGLYKKIFLKMYGDIVKEKCCKQKAKA